VWPLHWAYDRTVERFRYDPSPIVTGETPIQLKCLISDRSLERLALLLQRQLRAVGVDLVLETSSIDQAMARFQSGDFEAVLADARQGPTIVKPYMFWHSSSPLNWGRYSSPAVDRALDAIRGAANEEMYKAGVADFERAIIDDPPAIFLAWTQRARAVSKRFEVANQPGRDIVRTLSQWRPATQTVARSN
jgi:ABC-type transport system substrate-binding protein